jgi:hypothetical protein
MEIDRRGFLKTLAGVPLVLGLPSLLRGQDKVDGPAWFGKALERMKKENKPGVVIAIPEDRPERFNLGIALARLIEQGDEGVHEILCEAVFVCASAKLVRDAREGETVIVIDVDGRRVEGAKLDLKDFTKILQPLLHGEKNERLRERAGAIRKKTDEKVLAALKRIDSDSGDERDEATALLEKNAEGIVALLVFERLTAEEPERRARLRTVIKHHFETFDTKKPGPQLPYGTELRERTGCGDDSDTPVKCGMGSVPENGRKFLRFVTK